jgi:hypothetical protein
MAMKKILGGIAIAVLATFGAGSTVFAQSSGSFSASVGTAECAITDSTGVLTGGINSVPDITVKVSSGSGVALVITPSLVTGLFTNNKITSTSSTSTQNVGLEARVTVDGSTANVVPEEGSDGVIYDQRWIQISSSVISSLAGCTALATTTTPCFQLVESTLSAHSFNFYVWNLGQGTHTIHTDWAIEGGTNGEAACVGPGTVTVTQVKNFSFDSPLSF